MIDLLNMPYSNLSYSYTIMLFVPLVLALIAIIAYKEMSRALNPLYEQDRYISDIRKIALIIQNQAKALHNLSDEELKAQTVQLKKRLTDGVSLDMLMIKAYAIVSEASYRVLSERPFTSQIIASIALHRGMIAELPTGEGKTLAGVMPAYLNALTEKGVHIISPNDYLAYRDAHWVGQIFQYLGMTVGCVTSSTPRNMRKEQYNRDVTYITNSQVGFDFLYDNLALNASDVNQRPFNYVILDEADHILLDAAQTPLVVSGNGQNEAYVPYTWVSSILQDLPNDAYVIDSKDKSIMFTPKGRNVIESRLIAQGVLEDGLSLYSNIHNIKLCHLIDNALKAHYFFIKDIDYVVLSNTVHLVDTSTGRILYGHKYSEGLHQAIEAKERVSISPITSTLASITYQALFNLYPKKAGMTGTASTDILEFESIYNLSVLVIPSERKSRRLVHPDLLFRTNQEKISHIVDKVKQCNSKGQPVLIGTASVESSEIYSKALLKAGIKHSVLNAKHHAKEAEIIAQAGMIGKVTVVTNMAGRGTDVKLGGKPSLKAKNEETAALEKDQINKDKEYLLSINGLHVIGSERSLCRRIDLQLQGRSGRQGDTGEVQFYISLEDKLLQSIQPGVVSNYYLKNSLSTDGPNYIELPYKVTEALQVQFESFALDSRQDSNTYTNLREVQRNNIYTLRSDILFNKQPKYKKMIVENALNKMFAANENVVLPLAYDDDLQRTNLTHYERYLAVFSKFYNFWESYHHLADKEIRQAIIRSLDQSWRSYNEYIETLMRTRHYSNLLHNQDPYIRFKTIATEEFFQMYEKFEKKSCILVLEILSKLDAERRVK